MGNNYGSYLRVIKKREENREKKVKDIDFNVIADNFIGDFNITDMQLQEGNVKTHYTPHTTELLDRETFGINEFEFINTVSNGVKIGVQPRILEGLTNRFFNIVGRGHEVISVANVYHEDYGKSFTSTNVDIEIVPKNDYDLLRISTNDGAYIENRAYEGEENKDNPLNYRYTREFFFTNGKSGDIIKLTGSKYKATVNGKELPISKGYVVPNTNIFNTQRFMIAPSGTFRLRIEFYKLVNGVYKDTGIGFYGNIELKHTKGGSKF